MYLLDQIQDLVVRYVGGEISLESFREQFVPLFLNTSRSDIQTSTLAGNVESLYADLLAGEIDEREFVSQLNSLSPVAFCMEQPQCGIVSMSGSESESVASSQSSATPVFATCN
jgi:hypothetical protein